MAAPNIVNVSSIYGRTVGYTLGTTLNQSYVACPSNSNKVLKINNILVSNTGDTVEEVTVSFYDSTFTSSFALANAISIPPSSSLVILGKESSIYLEEGDTIQAGATSVNILDIIISYEELTDA
jgi:hypothetical protein